MQRIDELQGMKILVVEDDYMIATDLALELEESGAEVVGPAASVKDALELIDIHGDQLDCASLDVNVQGQRVFPVVDELIARDVPIVLSTGYDTRVLPMEYRSLPHCEKPVETAVLVRMLAASLRNDV
jgi:DNA-binding response OmpR family regulator